MIERYTLPEMGKIWEDKFKFDTWLKIEILLVKLVLKWVKFQKLM